MSQHRMQNGDLQNDVVLLSHNRKVPSKMSSLMEMKEIFHNADAVCFDVDSTVIREEGIDELAKFCGVGDAVAEMYVCLSLTSFYRTKTVVIAKASRYIACLNWAVSHVQPRWDAMLVATFFQAPCPTVANPGCLILLLTV